MIPIALVTGFLGSGKTTFLRHIIESHRDQRLAYLVNEFSPVDIDGHLLHSREDDVVALPGGSIFCTCLVSEFIQALTGLPERFPPETGRLEGVVIEASGVANPKVVEKMIHETGLDTLYALSAIFAVVDPGTFPTLLQTLPNIAAQVEASDTVILNKTDQFDEADIAHTEAEVLRIQPEARIVRAVYCQVELDLFPSRVERGLDGAYASCADPNYARFSLEPGELDVEALRAAVEGLKGDLYRMKGYAPVKGTLHYLDYSPASFIIRPADDTSAYPALVVIGRGSAHQRLHEFVRGLKRG